MLSTALKLVEVSRLEGGELLCSHCSSEFIVSKSDFVGYKNPNFDIGWNAPFHAFNNVRILYPHLIRFVHKNIKKLECPICCTKHMEKLEYSMFDAVHVLQSMMNDETPVTCAHCLQIKKVGTCLLIGHNIYACNSCLTKP